MKHVICKLSVSVLILILFGGGIVSAQQTVISATKMNMLYAGIDNPISILMSCVPSEAMIVSITNGTIIKSENENDWLARPKTPGIATIMVSAIVDGNTLTSTMDFRVSIVPVPLARVGNLAPGTVAKNILASQVGVLAVMDNFLFDLRYQVTEFTMRIGSGSPMKSNSAALTADQKAALQNATIPSETPVVFSDIKARIVGGEGSLRDLQDIVFTIQ